MEQAKQNIIWVLLLLVILASIVLNLAVNLFIENDKYYFGIRTEVNIGENLEPYVKNNALLIIKPVTPEERSQIKENEIVLYSSTYTYNGETYKAECCALVQENQGNGYLRVGDSSKNVANSELIKSTKIEEKAVYICNWIAPIIPLASSKWFLIGIIFCTAMYLIALLIKISKDSN